MPKGLRMPVDANPRANNLERMISFFSIDPNIHIIVQHGENLDLSYVNNKMLIPSSRQFTQFQYYKNKKAWKLSTIFACDHTYCGKFFRKLSNMFDHLRIHTGERPFRCPMPDCKMCFNQLSNQKKHLYAHKDTSLYISCPNCQGKFTKKQILSHFNLCHPNCIVPYNGLNSRKKITPQQKRDYLTDCEAALLGKRIRDQDEEDDESSSSGSEDSDDLEKSEEIYDN
jgi:hypothetical protein